MFKWNVQAYQRFDQVILFRLVSQRNVQYFHRSTSSLAADLSMSYFRCIRQNQDLRNRIFAHGMPLSQQYYLDQWRSLDQDLNRMHFLHPPRCHGYKLKTFFSLRHQLSMISSNLVNFVVESQFLSKTSTWNKNIQEEAVLAVTMFRVLWRKSWDWLT